MADKPDDTRTDHDFAALWSSDGVTRSFAPTAAGLPADLPFLFSAGQGFGPYLIVRPLGKGGMGQVYEAEETENGRRIALKLLSRGLGDDEERDRFLREGQLAASLSHPNCVYVFGTSEIQGFPIIAMELVPEGTLKDMVVPGAPMSPALAVDAILQVIAGLEAAASIGILHRDVKPSNCFVHREGRVLVGDFGLSVDASGHAAGDAGTILGTPGFASPEQLRGEPLDVRSDIYSVGATLFYLLAGRAPFEDRSTTGLMAKAAADVAPSLTDLRPEVPRRLSQVIAKCLAKESAARFATYASLRAALEPFGSAQVVPAPLFRRLIAGWLDGYITGQPALLVAWWFALFPMSPSHPGDALIVSAASLAMAALYYGLLEGHWGAAIGKWLTGLRVADTHQVAPGIRRGVARGLAFALPSQVLSLAITWAVVRRVPDINPGLLHAGVGVVWFLVLFCAARPSNGYLGLHDRLTRTRVVKKREHIEARDRVGPAVREEHVPLDVGLHVGPYALPPGITIPVASTLVVAGFDDRLKRRVRVELFPPGAPPLSAARRDLDRPARARWLGGRRIGDECWDAYEVIEGRSLDQVVAAPQRWSRVRHWLSDLAAELTAGLEDGTLPPLDSRCVSIGHDDRARVLESALPPAAEDLASVQRFLYVVAVAALRGVAPDRAANVAPDMPLPLPARTLLLSLRKAAFASSTDLTRAVATAVAVPAVLPRQRRAMQIGVSAVFPVLLTIVSLGGIVALNREKPTRQDLIDLQVCLSAIEEGEKSLNRSHTSPEDERKMTDAQIYIAEHLSERVAEPSTWTESFPNLAEHGGKERALRALAAHPVRTADEVRRADSTMADLFAEEKTSLARIGTWSGLWTTGIAVCSGTFVIPLLLGVLGASITGSGFTFRPFGAALVNRRGQPISRVRALWRVAVTWSLIPATLFLFKLKSDGFLAARVLLLQTVLLAALLALAIWAIARPTRGPQDRLAGTWIVPR